MVLFGEEPKRKPVRKNLRKYILNEVQKGKCKKCGKSIKQAGVRPIVHHKNVNPKDNRVENLIVVCPNCHDKIHQKEKKVRKKTTDMFGFTDYRVVKVGVRKKRKKKTAKTLKKKTAKKKSTVRKKPVRKKKTTRKKAAVKTKTTRKRKSTAKRKTTRKKPARSTGRKKTTRKKKSTRKRAR